ICVASTGSCKMAGDSCTLPTECCNLTCTGGSCAAVTGCIADNQACGAGVTGTCCSATCGANGTCTPLNNSCQTAGNPCQAGGDGGIAGGCCSNFCSNNVCALNSSYCSQVGDICYRASECCTGICNVPSPSPGTSSTGAGTCGNINTGTSC